MEITPDSSLVNEVCTFCGCISKGYYTYLNKRKSPKSKTMVAIQIPRCQDCLLLQSRVKRYDTREEIFNFIKKKKVEESMSFYYAALSWENGCRTGHVTFGWSDKNDISEDELSKKFDKLCEDIEQFKLKVVLSRNDFGPKNDMGVWIVQFPDESLEKKFIDFWKYFNVEQEHTKGLKKPWWHTKMVDDQADSIDVGQSLVVKKIAIVKKDDVKRELFVKHLK